MLQQVHLHLDEADKVEAEYSADIGATLRVRSEHGAPVLTVFLSPGFGGSKLRDVDVLTALRASITTVISQLVAAGTAEAR